MCILGLWFNSRSDARIRFVVCHNRDESLDRPVVPPTSDQKIIFGRDVSGGGTWMGYNRETGVFAALTNASRGLTEAIPGDNPSTPSSTLTSRGQLVLAVLEGEGSLAFERLEESCATIGALSSSPPSFPGAQLDLGEAYAGFNLIIGRVRASGDPKFFFVTNRPPVSSAVSRTPTTTMRVGPELSLAILDPTKACAWPFGPGTHALSNSTVNDAHWYKVAHLRSELDGLMKPFGSSEEGGSDEPLFEALLPSLIPVITFSESLPADKVMGDVAWSTEPRFEPYMQSHVFLPIVKAARYGTRSTTIVIGTRNCVYYCYRSFDPHDEKPADGSVASSKPVDADLAALKELASHLSRDADEAISSAPVGGTASGAVVDVHWQVFKSHLPDG